MKITEQITRDCCLPQDLKPYSGSSRLTSKLLKPRFCIHCGQVWVWDTDPFPDPAGGPRGSDWYKLDLGEIR